MYAFSCITRNKSLQKFVRKSWGLSTLLKSKGDAIVIWNQSEITFFRNPWKVRFFFPQSGQSTKPKATEHWEVMLFATLCRELRQTCVLKTASSSLTSIKPAGKSCSLLSLLWSARTGLLLIPRKILWINVHIHMHVPSQWLAHLVKKSDA